MVRGRSLLRYTEPRGVHGASHIWRSKAQVLLDEAAILACMQYVDLNPIRAGIATKPESSDFTSAQERIADLKTAEDVLTPDAQDNRIEHGERAGWLAPIPLEPKRQAVRSKKTGRRASSKGCLPISLGDYLQLLDWTGRQIRSGKRGAIPQNVDPLFERLGISGELWVDCVMNFRKWFRSSVGRPKSMEASAESRGHNRAISISSARRAFSPG